MTIVSYLDENDKRKVETFEDFDEAYAYYKKFNCFDIPYIYEIDRIMDEVILSPKQIS